ncbi:ankyrin repeat domain-containing protein [Chryseobacterium arthrosphaerae]|uniref:ankyrin repeat domain-containing protein n=1 Tax=Chryseobacterium arthrosphaerae TaxID=651561 RepID=UPI0023E2569E|nr:ankyrin repeat domain-containing protein [Chryseobacterium arthrosphaerae]WES96532.1 ankyrin repeat domain-containing protein [Chryseobacterium arthrosphaerae]
MKKIRKKVLYMGTTLIMLLYSQSAFAQERQSPQKELEKAFFHGARTSDIEILNEFLNSGVDVNYQGENGYTAMMIASYNGQKTAVEFLLSRKADLCIKDNRGNTALMGAIVAGEDETAELLIAKEECDSLTRKRAIEFASRFGRTKILNLLKKKHI